MYCAHCGKSLEAGSHFCVACGKPAGEIAATLTSSTPVTTSAPVSSVPASSPASSRLPAKHSRSGGVIFIAILWVLSGALHVMGGMIRIGGGYVIELLAAVPLVSLILRFWGTADEIREHLVHQSIQEGLVLFLLAFGYFYVAANLLRVREMTGRLAGIVFSIIVPLHSIYLMNIGEGSSIWHVIAIGFNAWVIYYLCKSSVKKSFAATDYPVAAPAS